MDCFNHHEKHAIGICKACGKGLCPDCATDLGHGLACKNNHEEIVEGFHRINQYSAKSIKPSLGQYSAVAFLVLAGLAYLWLAYTKNSGWYSFPVILGTIFIAFGLLLLVRIRTLLNESSTK